MAEATTDPGQLVREWIAVWNDRAYETVPEVLADSATIHVPAAPGGEVTGHDEFEAFLREQQAGYPDFTITIHEMLASDEMVLYDYTWRGTHRGEINGLPPTDREVVVTGMAKTLVADGKVQEDRIYYDFHDVLDQLGLTVPAVLAHFPKLAWRKLQTRFRTLLQHSRGIERAVSDGGSVERHGVC
jgi:steroid delta-isomerase-like uncharacterized protein